jgi:hypothetical protein
MLVNIDIQELSHITLSIANYEYLPNIFQNLGSKEQNEKIKEFWNKNIVKRETNSTFNDAFGFFFQQWKEINLHVVPQTWGNTSGGWQGIGGSAMTKRYTVIIENHFYGFSCVYYNGELAYICEIDDLYKEHMATGYRIMPGMSPYKESLTIIYKKTR